MELFHLASETFNYHCPFNTSHTMPQKTLTKHIAKCPDRPDNYKSCVYHMSHVMPAAELEAHEKNCPNRILFDTAAFESEDFVRPLPVVGNVPVIEYEESWDDMNQCDGVLENITKKPILMKAIHGSTRSERKIYRNALHQHDLVSDNKKQLESKGNKEHQIISIVEHKSNPELFIGKRPRPKTKTKRPRDQVFDS